MKLLRILPLLVFGLLAIFFWFGLSLDPQKLPTPKIGQTLPVFDLPMLLGDNTTHFTPEILNGERNLLIVWASWCDACREEQEFLMSLSQQTGLKLFGLNYKDDPNAARIWLADWGNPFYAIGLDQQGKLGLDLGVYGTPETYLIDQNGKILHRYAGLLTAEIWQQEFKKFFSTTDLARVH